MKEPSVNGASEIKNFRSGCFCMRAYSRSCRFPQKSTKITPAVKGLKELRNELWHKCVLMSFYLQTEGVVRGADSVGHSTGEPRRTAWRGAVRCGGSGR